MVAPIAPDGTTQWEVMSWAVENAQHLPSSAHAAVLYYLCANAFYQPDNPEGAPVGRVLYGASKYDAIMRGTALRSKKGVRTMLDDLQDMAYVMRARRQGRNNHDPLEISVLWEGRADEHREKMRQGLATLPAGLIIRPTRPVANAKVIPLRAVEEAT